MAGTWSPTATQGVSVASLIGALDKGAVADSQVMTIRVALAMPGKSALAAFVAAATDPASATYGKYLTPAQVATRYGLSAAQVDAAVSYLKQSGFTNVVAEPNHLLISADGTAAQVMAAFNTRLEQVAIAGKTLFVNTAPAQVPEALGGIVAAVLGLNSVGTMKSTLALPSVPQYLTSYTPKQLQSIYDVGVTGAAVRSSIAIMAEGNVANVLTDLATAESKFGLPVVKVTVVPTGAASTDVSNQDEFDLDTQYSSGLAQNLRMLYLYDAPSLSDSDLTLEFSRWQTDDKAQAASASLGECEYFANMDGAMAADDAIFLAAAGQGQTFFASAGDTGSFCPVAIGSNGVPAGAPLVNYPAASPYVVAVGGTTLFTTSAGAYEYETAWVSGGGGVSLYEPSSVWQNGYVPLVAAAGMRAVPDIAMDADPNSGAQVYVNGTEEVVGGTSLSSPMALGIWARALSRSAQLGFAPPHLYKLYNGENLVPSYPKGGYHDITLGANGLYSALPGYDLTTGLGTFNIHQFTYALPFK